MTTCGRLTLRMPYRRLVHQADGSSIKPSALMRSLHRTLLLFPNVFQHRLSQRRSNRHFFHRSSIPLQTQPLHLSIQSILHQTSRKPLPQRIRHLRRSLVRLWWLYAKDLVQHFRGADGVGETVVRVSSAVARRCVFELGVQVWKRRSRIGIVCEVSVVVLWRILEVVHRCCRYGLDGAGEREIGKGSNWWREV